MKNSLIWSITKFRQYKHIKNKDHSRLFLFLRLERSVVFFKVCLRENAQIDIPVMKYMKKNTKFSKLFLENLFKIIIWEHKFEVIKSDYFEGSVYFSVLCINLSEWL